MSDPESLNLQRAVALLPPGPAWDGFREPGGRGHDVLAVKAALFDRIEARAADLLREVHPLSATEMLPVMEAEVGLPDVCAIAGATLQERRQAVWAKWLMGGGCSIAYYTALAASLGYQVAITEHRPFICGISRCGDPLDGAAECRRYLTVKVLGPRGTYFRAGQSRCGERLLSIARAEDLECRLNKIKHAHIEIIFSYTGV